MKASENLRNKMNQIRVEILDTIFAFIGNNTVELNRNVRFCDTVDTHLTVDYVVKEFTRDTVKVADITDLDLMELESADSTEWKWSGLDNVTLLCILEELEEGRYEIL